MDNFIGNNVKFLADWGQLIVGSVMVACICIIYLIVRRNKYFLPKGLGSGLMVLVLLVITLLCTLIFARITMVKPGVMTIIHQLEDTKGKAKELSFQLVSDNANRTIEDYRGKVVLLNFWATWCKPCLTEMPDLNKLQTTYRDKGLEVITISDEKRDRLLRFHEKNNMLVNSGYVTSFDWATMGPERPVTFLINKEGVILDYYTGAYDYQFFESKIVEHL